jgi:predicted DCC family thiol-disulfide oxidoreductase YuxK
VRGVLESTLIFDGDCGHCTSSARWIAARWPTGTTARIVASQRLDDIELSAIGLTRRDVARAAWWIENDRPFRGHEAVARALVEAGGGYRLAGLLLVVPPFSWAGAACYAAVARCRHLLPGSAACRA